MSFAKLTCLHTLLYARCNLVFNSGIRVLCVASRKREKDFIVAISLWELKSVSTYIKLANYNYIIIYPFFFV